jgi:hypothetical protein
VHVLSHLLNHFSVSTPYLSACACVLLIAKAALACVRVAAAVIAIVARDKRSRAERALDVLRVLCRDRHPPEGGSP